MRPASTSRYATWPRVGVQDAWATWLPAVVRNFPREHLRVPHVAPGVVPGAPLEHLRVPHLAPGRESRMQPGSSSGCATWPRLVSPDGPGSTSDTWPRVELPVGSPGSHPGEMAAS